MNLGEGEKFRSWVLTRSFPICKLANDGRWMARESFLSCLAAHHPADADFVTASPGLCKKWAKYKYNKFR